MLVFTDYEIESPTAIDSRLPDLLGFVVLLGMKGGMGKVVEKKVQWFRESLRTGGGSAA